MVYKEQSWQQLLFSFILVCGLKSAGEKCAIPLDIRFLDAVNVASVAIIVAICWEMGRDSILDWRTLLIAISSVAVTFGYPKVNSAFIVIYGALAGYLLSFGDKNTSVINGS
jgi:chromate transport protein ChrA